MKQNKIIIMVMTVLFIIVAGVLYCCNSTKVEESMILTEENSASPEESASAHSKEIQTSQPKTAEPQKDVLIYVHICGEVVNSGVYEIKDTTRLADLIKMAGGLTKNASGDSVNQAQKLTDGQKVYIPSKKEVKSIEKEWNADSVDSSEVISNVGSQNTGKSSLVNINKASTEELMTLPGIGEAKANSIIKYREANQGFQSIEDIKKIEGIKAGVYSKIQDLITVN